MVPATVKKAAFRLPSHADAGIGCITRLAILHPLPVRLCEDGIDTLGNRSTEDIGGHDEAKLQQSGIDAREFGVPLTLASFPIDDHDEIIVLSDKGTLIRLKVDSIRITGRNAMGVRIINLKEAEKVISITRVVSDKSDDDIEGNDNDDNTDIIVEEAK